MPVFSAHWLFFFLIQKVIFPNWFPEIKLDSYPKIDNKSHKKIARRRKEIYQVIFHSFVERMHPQAIWLSEWVKKCLKFCTLGWLISAQLRRWWWWLWKTRMVPFLLSSHPAVKTKKLNFLFEKNFWWRPLVLQTIFS